MISLKEFLLEELKFTLYPPEIFKKFIYKNFFSSTATEIMQKLGTKPLNSYDIITIVRSFYGGDVRRDLDQMDSIRDGLTKIMDKYKKQIKVNK